MKQIFTATALGLCLLSSQAYASGYQLNEYSITNMGRSFAGAGVVGDDYSAIAYNPAGMTLKGSGLQSSLTITEVAAEVKGKGAYSGQKTRMDFGVALPAVYGQYQINDQWFVGGGIYAPYGLATKYKNFSFLDGKARKSSLEIIDYNASTAYKVNSKFSIGASFVARYIYGNMTNNIDGRNPHSGAAISNVGFSEFDLDGWTYTGTLGLMYSPTENTRIGLAYKPKSIQRVKGDHTVTVFPPYNAIPEIAAMGGIYPDGKSSPDLPQTVLLSIYHQATDKLGLSASARHTRWGDSFQEFSMTSSFTDKMHIQPVKYNWKDSWTISAGADYQIDDSWTIRLGGAWDQSPNPDNAHRTHRIPDGDRIWVSGGLSYQYQNWQVDMGYVHIFMKDGYIRNSVNGDIDSRYDNHSNMYGLGVQYNF